MLREDGFAKSAFRNDQGMVWGRFREGGKVWVTGTTLVCDEIVTGSDDMSTTRVVEDTVDFWASKYPDAAESSKELLAAHFPQKFKTEKTKKKAPKKKVKK